MRDSDVAGARPIRGLALCGAVLCLAAGIGVAGGQTAVAVSVLSGAYTEAQALRGQALYYTHCLACHGEDMSGLDQAPPLAGPQFAGIWDGEPLAGLVGRIEAMPPGDTGSLARAEVVAILAYMLWFNGLPLGEQPLSDDPGILSQTNFRAPPLPGQ